MKARALTFIGDCQGCNTRAESRAAVEVFIDTRNQDRSAGELICAACARRLALMLKAAADEATEKVRRGLVMRSDGWVKRKPAVKGVNDE